MQPNGRLATPDKSAWGNDETFCSELVHIYCLSPIKEAGELFERKDYLNASDKILSYYKREQIGKIKNFSLLSHFYAYVMEGLYDLGEYELCYEAMMRLEKYRNKKNGILGLNDVPLVCSTGMFQLAIVWYKLGDLTRGNTLFEYAASLQNKPGVVWELFGSRVCCNVLSRKKKPYYFPFHGTWHFAAGFTRIHRTSVNNSGLYMIDHDYLLAKAKTYVSIYAQ